VGARPQRARREAHDGECKAAREEGHKEGHEKAREESRREKAAMLAQLLAKKFGPLAEAQRERVEGADGATLKRWFDASFDAVSIDDLLRL
jgi:flagellar biosynthesis/type III secretory pathway protein FliH